MVRCTSHKNNFFINLTWYDIVVTNAHIVYILEKLYISQKQLPRKMKTRLVITMCVGYIFRQLYLWQIQHRGIYHTFSRTLNTRSKNGSSEWVKREWVKRVLHFSQKQLSRIMKSRLVITNCAGYIFWQLFLRRV